MGDKLKYRIPGKGETLKNGRFFKLENVSDYKGLLISDFDQSQYYGFEEGVFDINTDTKEKPYCLSKDEYLIAGKELVKELNSNHLDKVILSRVLKQECNHSPSTIYKRLLQEYPNAFVYQIESSILGTWIGATPEILMKSIENKLSTVSLAGTKSANDVSEWKSKEKEEQQFVTDYIEQCLIDLNIDVKSKSSPVEHLAGPVKHLKTTFTFDDSIDKVELLKALHPTPAVCGIPKHLAKNWIKDNEPHERKLYTGMIGEMTEECNMYVNLRCMQLIDQNAFLYVGGGYTKDSIPEMEWQETERKAMTLLNVLNKS